MAKRRRTGGVHLSDHDLRQLDEAYVGTLSQKQAQALLIKALADLKTARERLGQNPSNSSCSPNSRAPWEQSDEDGQETEAEVPSPSTGDGEEISAESLSRK